MTALRSEILHKYEYSVLKVLFRVVSEFLKVNKVTDFNFFFIWTNRL